MPIPYHLRLRAEQAQELERLRDHAPQPYVRERAASILAVAQGQSLRHAARHAGLKPHRVDTVAAWVHRYQAEGVAGLRIRKGRGRKPASFPAVARYRAPAGAAPGRPTARALRADPAAQPLVAGRHPPGSGLAARALSGDRLADPASQPAEL